MKPWQATPHTHVSLLLSRKMSQLLVKIFLSTSF